MATLLVCTNPEKYGTFVIMENGKPVIYVRLNKALYGTVQASMLFWKDLKKEPKKWGFKINPYDECVVNMEIDGS